MRRFVASSMQVRPVVRVRLTPLVVLCKFRGKIRSSLSRCCILCHSYILRLVMEFPRVAKAARGEEGARGKTRDGSLFKRKEIVC